MYKRARKKILPQLQNGQSKLIWYLTRAKQDLWLPNQINGRDDINLEMSNYRFAAMLPN